jgi:hypothetical protein
MVQLTTFWFKTRWLPKIDTVLKPTKLIFIDKKAINKFIYIKMVWLRAI